MAAKWTYGNTAYMVGLVLALALGLVGAGLGAAAMYVTAIIAVAGVVVGATNLSKAEGQKFLLWAIAAGVLGYTAFSGVFTNFGLKIIEDVVLAIGKFFFFVALTKIVLIGNEMFKSS
jgi:hypothetical protein